MKIISWHPVLTDHQSYTLEALQQTGKCVLKVYVGNHVNADRKSQGWVSQHSDSLYPEVIPKSGWLIFAFTHLRENRSAVHFFGSPFEQTKLIIILLMALAMGIRVYLISEPYSPISVGYQNDRGHFINWLKAQIRPNLYYIYGLLLRRRISGVFAISCLAVKQYQRIGISKEKLFPFGYFVPRLNINSMSTESVKTFYGSSLKILFVGNLISRKGLDILIAAVKSINKQGLSVLLDVYGPGDISQYDFNEKSVRYRGLIPFGNSQAVIAEYDLLVLPSRYDGWGVVVNEALMAGVPVICSNQVGAGVVVDMWQCGATFESENVGDLIEKIKNLLENPELLKNMQIAAKKARVALNPEIAARYMFDVISQKNNNRINPECHWYKCQ